MWSSPRPSSRRGADHAVGDVAVGLARGDLEAAGQHGAGQRDDDEVADREVRRAADDAARLALADVDRAVQRIGLAVGARLAPRWSSTRPTTSGPAMSAPRLVDRLDLEAGSDEPLGELAAGDVGRQVDVLAQPGQRDAHQISVPNGRGEPHVALDHVAHVLDAVAEHQRALDAHAEREPAVALGVDAAGDQHPRVDHAAAAPLDPALATSRCGTARSGLPTESPRQTKQRRSISARRLGEREVRRAAAGSRCRRRTSRAAKWSSVPLQVGHRDALVDDQPLDLVEDRACGSRRARRCGRRGPGRPRRSAARGCSMRADLHRRGLGAQHDARLRRARRRTCPASARAGWSGRHVERVEVEPLGLDLGALGDLVAHRDEDVGDPLLQGGQRVPGAARAAGPTAA